LAKEILNDYINNLLETFKKIKKKKKNPGDEEQIETTYKEYIFPQNNFFFWEGEEEA
jgi:hypothetical protein